MTTSTQSTATGLFKREVLGVSVGQWLFRLVAYALLLGFGFLMIFPFLYMMTTSLKDSTDVFRFPPRLLPLSQNTVSYEGEDAPVFLFEVDGNTERFVDTGERVRFGFFTSEDNLNIASPRESVINLEIPLDEAVETGETVTLTDAAGNEDSFDVYEVSVEGETQRLLLAYRGSQNRFVTPDDASTEVFAVTRTATQDERVEFQWRNYEAFFGLQLDRALVNTILVTVCVVTGQLVTSIFGGYAFSRVRFRGRDTLFLLYLGSIMIPFVVLIIPMYRLMVILDWQNQLVSLILPWIFTAYGTFLMRQFFMTIPKDLEEAAMLDGASRMRILWQIFVPLSRPAIATLAIFSFLYAWNSFLWPLLIINEANETNHVLTLSLIKLSNIAADRPNIVLTGAAIAILPPMIVFVIAQRYFIEGLASSGLKG
ncbi:MAG: carbohydrate ABC transporter permease [Deinococcota bacterium]